MSSISSQTTSQRNNLSTSSTHLANEDDRLKTTTIVDDIEQDDWTDVAIGDEETALLTKLAELEASKSRSTFSTLLSKVWTNPLGYINVKKQDLLQAALKSITQAVSEKASKEISRTLLSPQSNFLDRNLIAEQILKKLYMSGFVAAASKQSSLHAKLLDAITPIVTNLRTTLTPTNANVSLEAALNSIFNEDEVSTETPANVRTTSIDTTNNFFKFDDKAFSMVKRPIVLREHFDAVTEQFMSDLIENTLIESIAPLVRASAESFSTTDKSLVSLIGTVCLKKYRSRIRRFVQHSIFNSAVPAEKRIENAQLFMETTSGKKQSSSELVLDFLGEQSSIVRTLRGAFNSIRSIFKTTEANSEDDFTVLRSASRIQEMVDRDAAAAEAQSERELEEMVAEAPSAAAVQENIENDRLAAKKAQLAADAEQELSDKALVDEIPSANDIQAELTASQAKAVEEANKWVDLNVKGDLIQAEMDANAKAVREKTKDPLVTRVLSSTLSSVVSALLPTVSSMALDFVADQLVFSEKSSFLDKAFVEACLNKAYNELGLPVLIKAVSKTTGAHQLVKSKLSDYVALARHSFANSDATKLAFASLKDKGLTSASELTRYLSRNRSIKDSLLDTSDIMIVGTDKHTIKDRDAVVKELADAVMQDKISSYISALLEESLTPLLRATASAQLGSTADTMVLDAVVAKLFSSLRDPLVTIIESSYSKMKTPSKTRIENAKTILSILDKIPKSRIDVNKLALRALTTTTTTKVKSLASKAFHFFTFGLLGKAVEKLSAPLMPGKFTIEF